MPEPVRRLFTDRRLEETPKSGDEAFARSRWWTILSNAQVRQAAAAAAARAGFAVTMDNRCDDWDYAAAGDYLLQRLHELRQGVSRVCLISGGEVTVRVENGGVGGRNQQFALHCAGKIAGQQVTVLSAGTDGIDGNSPATGAVVDGSTEERARSRGLDLAGALVKFDAFPFFENLGDAILTGPTGNNLRDLRVLMAY
jgi:hydroxypyruvate reductase